MKPAEPGSVLSGRFELVTMLGRGSMGVVWRARDRETGQLVAIKLLAGQGLHDADVRARFEREAELAARVDSRRVVRVLGHGVDADQPFIVMELVEGHSLRDVMAAHGKYSWAETKPLMLTVARGLADAHVEGVIHRDVKPTNIMVTPDGSIKLADFGIARAVDQTRLTRASITLGTPAYLAPEGSRDQRSDLYALGIVAYEMLAGMPPFVGDTPNEVLLAHLRTQPDLTKIPAVSRRIIGWLLAKDAARRPQSAEALIAALLAGDTATLALPPSGLEEAPSHVRRGMLFGALVVAAAVVAFAAVQSGVIGASAASRSPSPSGTAAATATAGPTLEPSPTATPTSTPNSTPTPPATPTPAPTLAQQWPYVADWSAGLNGWSKSNGFDVRYGQLVNDGTGALQIPGAQAPVLPPTANYAVEAQIRLVSGCGSFGLVARWDGTVGGYALGVRGCNTLALTAAGSTDWLYSAPGTPMASAPWNPAGVHTYRLEVRDADITALVDGKPQFTHTDLQFPDAGRVGLWCSGPQIVVVSFKVEPLP
jgi:serine/threonine-protein kinase